LHALGLNSPGKLQVGGQDGLGNRGVDDGIDSSSVRCANITHNGRTSTSACHSLKASELAYDPTTVNATEFVFDNPVSIKAGTEFFAVVGPFPNDNGDDIAILLVRRGEGEKCTAYHFVYDEDENYNYLETGTWYKNVDDPISLAVAPKLKYNVNTAISTVSTNKQVTGVTYYNVAGVASVTPFDGINIVVTRYSDGSQTATKILR